MSDERRAFARVQVIVEVDAGCWGPDCTLAQATKQAQDTAITLVANLFTKRNDVRVLRVDHVAMTFSEKAK